MEYFYEQQQPTLLSLLTGDGTWVVALQLLCNNS